MQLAEQPAANNLCESAKALYDQILSQKEAREQSVTGLQQQIDQVTQTIAEERNQMEQRVTELQQHIQQLEGAIVEEKKQVTELEKERLPQAREQATNLCLSAGVAW